MSFKSKFVTKLSLKSPSHLKYVARLPCEIHQPFWFTMAPFCLHQHVHTVPTVWQDVSVLWYMSTWTVSSSVLVAVFR